MASDVWLKPARLIGGFVTELVHFAPCKPVFLSIRIFHKLTLYPMIAIFSPAQAMLRLHNKTNIDKRLAHTRAAVGFLTP